MLFSWRPAPGEKGFGFNSKPHGRRQTTSTPMDRAVPVTMLMAASML